MEILHSHQSCKLRVQVKDLCRPVQLGRNNKLLIHLHKDLLVLNPAHMAEFLWRKSHVRSRLGARRVVRRLSHTTHVLSVLYAAYGYMTSVLKR